MHDLWGRNRLSLPGVPVSIKRPNDAATSLNLNSYRPEEAESGVIFFEVSPMGMIGGVPVGMQMPGCEAVGRIFLKAKTT